jgi:hypothetical protein
MAGKQTARLAVIHDFEIPEYRRSCKMFRNKYEVRGLNPSTGVALKRGIRKEQLIRVNSIRCDNSAIVDPSDVKRWATLLSGA